MENKAEYQSKKSGKMMEILTEVVRYVYYDEEPETLALLISTVRYKHQKRLEDLEELANDEHGEFQARFMLTVMLFEARAMEKMSEIISRMRPGD